MSDDHTQPFAGLAQWLGDDPDGATPPEEQEREPRSPSAREPRRHASRRTVRAVALLAPWLLALAALAASTDGAAPRSDPPDLARRQAPERGRPGRSDPPLSRATEAATAPDGVAATAVRLVRDALTGRHGDVTAAVDVAVAESPRPLGSDQWLVRVQTVVLRGDARRWRSATHETWAVPIGMGAGAPVGLEQPWQVATGQPEVSRPDWRAATVDERAVRSALRTVGARAASDLAAQQHPVIAHVIRVRVAAEGRTRHVWLTTEPTVRVLGAPAGAGATGHITP